MGCWITVLGGLALALALLYIPFLTVKNLALSLCLAGAAFLLGLSAYRSARKTTQGNRLVTIGGSLLMAGSVVCVGLILAATAPKDSPLRLTVPSRVLRQPTANVTLAPHGPEGQAVDEDLIVVYEGGVYSDRYTTALHLEPVLTRNTSNRTWKGRAILADVEEGGTRVRFKLTSPLDYETVYRVKYDGAIAAGGKKNGVHGEWELVTGRPQIVEGVNPQGFSITIRDDGSSSLQLQGDTIRHGSPASTVVLYSAHGNSNFELARGETKPGWPTRVEIDTKAETLLSRTLWVAVLDANGRPVVRTLVTTITDEDGRGIITAEDRGVYTNPDEITIHYGSARWADATGRPLGSEPTPLKIRVERLPDHECLVSRVDGFRTIGCFDITAESLVVLFGKSYFETTRSETTYRFRETGRERLLPSFHLSIPVPEDIPNDTPAIAVHELSGTQFTPPYQIDGIGRVTTENEHHIVRFIEGGGIDHPATTPSGINPSTLFEADAMVGRRAILVPEIPASTTLIVGSGWTSRNPDDEPGEEHRNGPGFYVYYTTVLPFRFDPPSVGNVRKDDGFVLPMVIGETSLLVLQDPVTGWILKRNEVPVPHTNEWLADIGSLDELPDVDRWTGMEYDREIRSFPRRH